MSGASCIDAYLCWSEVHGDWINSYVDGIEFITDFRHVFCVTNVNQRHKVYTVFFLFF